MMGPGLSYDDTPPFSAPIRFFLTAPLFGVAAGLTLIFGGEILVSRWTPGALAITHLFAAGSGVLGGWFYKLIVLGLIWAFLHHLIAGLRHVWLDITHQTTKKFGRVSAQITLVVSLVVTLALGFKLFF